MPVLGIQISVFFSKMRGSDYNGPEFPQGAEKMGLRHSCLPLPPPPPHPQFVLNDFDPYTWPASHMLLADLGSIQVWDPVNFRLLRVVRFDSRISWFFEHCQSALMI